MCASLYVERYGVGSIGKIYVAVQISVFKGAIDYCICANMYGDDYENTQKVNNVFLLEVDSMQKLGHNFFGILVICAKCPASSS